MAPPASLAAQAEAQADAALVGTLAGSFRIQEVLGRGGMGTVYRAEHPVIGSRVAIKFLHEHLVSNAGLVARFYDEARAVNLIGHENIIAIYDLAVLPPRRFYFVMEYLEGRKLTSLVREGALAAPAALRILTQLCDALQAAHAHGVVHRDLKPDNVFLVTREGRSDFVKLLDFGISKLRGPAEGRPQTAAGTILGTPEYMAPEQCNGDAIDGRTDVYALGTIAFQLLTGRLPFTAPNFTAMLLAQLQQEPPRPSAVNPRLHPAWDAPVLRALAKRPEDRPPTMDAFCAALEAAGAADPSIARSPPPRAQPAPTSPTPQPVHARHAAGFEVEVRVPGPRPLAILRATDVSRGGMYLCDDTGPAPPVLSAVQITIQPPHAERPLEVVGEVVRQVSASEAQAWNICPGFAVQFVHVTPELRTALGQVVERLPRASADVRAPEPADDPEAEARLAYFEKRVASSHYDFLGLAPDADFLGIRARARALRDEIGALRTRALSPGQARRVLAVLERLAQALEALGDPERRAVYDGQRGNFLGVTRCMVAGLSSERVDELHRSFVVRRADAVEAAAVHVRNAEEALLDDDEVQALAEYEAALRLTPLDLSLHRQYWSLKREFPAAGEAPGSP